MPDITIDRRFSDWNAFLKEGKPLSDEIEMVGFQGKVPKWKTIDFFMTKANRKNISWRDIDGIDVNKNVLLIPQTHVLKINGGFDAKPDNEAQSNKVNSMLDYLKEASSVLNDEVVVGEYSMPVFENLKSMQIDGTMDFEFLYGNAGLYSGFEEVVKPIVALLCFFSPDTKGAGAAKTVNTPWPTKSKAMFEKVKGAVDTVLGSSYGDIKDSIMSTGSIGEGISNANAAIQNLMNAGALSAVQSSEWHNLYMSYGRMTIGPLMYTEYSYSFDMENLDEWGWPIKGTFTISGMISPRKATKQGMLSAFTKM